MEFKHLRRCSALGLVFLLLGAGADAKTINLGDPIAVPKLSDKEYKENIQTLSEVRDGNIPNGYDGGVLFDGVVSKLLGRDKYGQTLWLSRVQHMYTGADQVKGGTVKIVTAPAKWNGVALKQGGRYRFFAIDFGLLDDRPSGYFRVGRGTVIPQPDDRKTTRKQ